MARSFIAESTSGNAVVAGSAAQVGGVARARFVAHGFAKRVSVPPAISAFGAVRRLAEVKVTGAIQGTAAFA
jgi:hypothetical protein